MDAEGAKAVSLRWVGTDKGDAGRPNYKSRLVVREIKKALKKSDVHSAAELFSGISALETVKAPLSLFVSHNQEEEKGKRTLAMYDISRAHFHGVPVRSVLWNSQMTDTIWNILACSQGACMAQCSLVSALRADPERTRFSTRPQHSIFVGAR